MAELVVISHDDAETAEAVRKKWFELSNVSFGDAVVAVADEHGKIHCGRWSIHDRQG